MSEEPFIQLAKLATHLERLKPCFEPILKQLLSEDEVNRRPNRETGFELVKLGEDALLCGFAPWFRGLDWSVYRRFGPRALPSELAQSARRLEAILFCIDFLEGLEKPILKWSQVDKAHISLAETAFSPQDRANARLSNMLSKEQDILDESYSDDESAQPPVASTPPTMPEDTELYRLKHRKNELERRRAEEEREARRVQKQILDEHVSVTLEVRPRIVVPDTNCFVDHLTEVTRLASSGSFQLRVPLVVLNELDGLSRGGGGGGGAQSKYASREHAERVQDSAKRAVAYLRDRPANTKCVTSRGNLVASLGVTTEEDGGEGKKNDDLILDTCVCLASSQQQQHDQQQQSRSSSERMRHVYREVVLLTEDRNLRLKAHLTDVPVNRIAGFMSWAFGGSSSSSNGQN